MEALPLELQRNYTLIRQLDESAEELLAQIATESTSLTKPQKTLTSEERKKRLEHIGQLLNETLKKGEEKLALAKSTYDTVRTCRDMVDERMWILIAIIGGQTLHKIG